LATVKVYLQQRGFELLVPLNRTKYPTKVMDIHWKITGVVVKHISRNMRRRYQSLVEEFIHPGEDNKESEEDEGTQMSS